MAVMASSTSLASPIGLPQIVRIKVDSQGCVAGVPHPEACSQASVFSPYSSGLYPVCSLADMANQACKLRRKASQMYWREP